MRERERVLASERERREKETRESEREKRVLLLGGFRGMDERSEKRKYASEKSSQKG